MKDLFKKDKLAQWWVVWGRKWDWYPLPLRMEEDWWLLVNLWQELVSENPNTWNNEIRVSISQVDLTNNSLKIIDYPHAELHKWDHYFYTDHVELDNALSQNYLITTSNTLKWGHMHIICWWSAITQIEVYEATDKLWTTLQQVFNNNRNSSNVATLSVHKWISWWTTDWLRLVYHKWGSSTNQSSSGVWVRSDEELLLKQNTKYIVRITSFTNDNLCNLSLYWYEHTNLV